MSLLTNNMKLDESVMQEIATLRTQYGISINPARYINHSLEHTKSRYASVKSVVRLRALVSLLNLDVEKFDQLTSISLDRIALECLGVDTSSIGNEEGFVFQNETTNLALVAINTGLDPLELIKKYIDLQLNNSQGHMLRAAAQMMDRIQTSIAEMKPAKEHKSFVTWLKKQGKSSIPLTDRSIAPMSRRALNFAARTDARSEFGITFPNATISQIVVVDYIAKHQLQDKPGILELLFDDDKSINAKLYYYLIMSFKKS